MQYLVALLELSAIYMILAISVNYLVGNAGVMFVGQAAFFAIGGYSAALFTSAMGLSSILALAIAVLISILLATSFGSIVMRLSGQFLLIASLGLCEIVRSCANNATFTGGAQGLTVHLRLFSTAVLPADLQLPISISFVLILEIVFFHRLDKSPKGRLIRALRDDPLLLASLGHSTRRIQVQVLVITAIWASVAGVLFAHYSQYIDPTSFTMIDSLMILIAIMIGGISSISGSVLAGLILVGLPGVLRLLYLPSSVVGPIHEILFALFVLSILKFRPKGLFGRATLP